MLILIITFLWVCWSIRAQPCTIVVSAVALWLLAWIVIFLFTNINSLHILWIIPVGVFVVPRLYYITTKVPILNYIILISATLLRNIIWIGIDKDKRTAEIKECLNKITEGTVEKFFEENKK